MRLIDLFRQKPKQLEQRSSGISANSQIFKDFFPQFFGTNSTGKVVNERTAMSIAAVHACVEIIANSISSMPLKLYETNGREKIIDKKSPSALIIEEPNQIDSGFNFRKYMTAVAVLNGNSYAYVFRDRGGNPVNIWPLQNCSVNPVISNGELYYQIGTNDPIYKDLPSVVASIDIIHIKGLCIGNQFTAISPIQYHAESLGIQLAAMSAIGTTFKTGAKKWMLTNDKKWETEQQKATVNSMERVMSGEGLVFSVPSGIAAQTISLSPAEAGYIEAMGFTNKDIARMFGVPASMIDADDGANKTSVEQNYLNFINQTLLPWAVGIETELKRKLIPRKDRANKYYKHNFNALMRADAASRAEYISKMVLNGIYSRNEARDLDDMNPYADGDEFMVPFNEVAASQFVPLTQAKIDSMDKTMQQTNNPNGNN